MEEIQATARPYNLLHEVAALIHTARSANDQLVSDARGPALRAIQSHLDFIGRELDSVSADADLRKTACNELSKLLAAATQATSIAHIAQAQQTAEDAYDRALTLIEKAQTPEPEPTPAVSPDSTKPVEEPKPPKPKVKKRRIIEVKTLCAGSFIETNEDLESFLSKLRTELTAALEADERVQIK